MKSSKSLVLGLAILLGVTSAFTSKATKASHKKFAGVNWSFNGTQAQINDASKYTYSATAPACSGSTNRCSVVANRSTANPMQPDLSSITAEGFKN